MNKSILIACFLFVACNNSNEQSTASGDTTNSSSIKAGNAAPATGNCSNLYLFQKGAVIEAKSYNAAGNEVTQQTSKVLSVSNEGSAVVSEVEMKNNSGGEDERTFTGKYRCDGTNLYVDLSSLFGELETKRARIEGDPIQFPLNVKEGQTLPDAKYTFVMDQSGKGMKTTATIKDRQVVGKESVTTPAGTFNCYKITANIDANIDMPGVDEKMMKSIKANMPKQSFVMYYDPAIGIVKFETFTGSTLSGRSEVTAIRK